MVNNNFIQINVIYNLEALLERLCSHVMIKVMGCMGSSISCYRMAIEIVADTSSQVQFVITCLFFDVYSYLDQSILVLN